MPVISMTMAPTTADHKKRLVADLTAAAAAITEIPEQFFTVTILELSRESLGVGGRTVAELQCDEP